MRRMTISKKETMMRTIRELLRLCPSKEAVYFDSAAHAELLRGSALITEAVGRTLGPAGKTSVISAPGQETFFTKDGATVARSLTLSHPVQAMAADALRDAAARTVEQVGDGTSTTIVLAHEIYRLGLEKIRRGAKPSEIVRELHRASRVIFQYLKDKAKKIETREELAQVASIAANNDKEIGSLVAAAVEQTDWTGAVIIEDSPSTQSFSAVKKGLLLDRGYLSPHFITDEKQQECVLSDPYILIHDGSLALLAELLPWIEDIAKEKKSLLIIANEITGEAFQTLVLNRLRGTLQVAAIEPPDMGDARKEALEDIAIFTGGRYFRREEGLFIGDLKLSQLGTAKKAVVGKKTTIISEGGGKAEEIAGRVEALRLRVERSDEKTNAALKMRLARLSGGIGTLFIGGHTEAEIREKKYRAQDAIDAAAAAVEEGVVPGSGIILLQAAELAKELLKTEPVQDGLDILSGALKSPFHWIIKNADLDPIDVWRIIRDKKSASYGFDAAARCYCDLLKQGVLDPAKSVRVCLENALSIASLLLNAGSAIVLPPASASDAPGITKIRL
jgi:chaperonin GroEL